uniref:Uncharacterized protein n=2 Tax=Anas TaxID=8835 RepID=A0A8B9VB24_9AVES
MAWRGSSSLSGSVGFPSSTWAQRFSFRPAAWIPRACGGFLLCFEYSEHKLFKISVLDVTAEAVGVAIAAPPSEGEANAELCRYLSKVLEVKKSEVILEKGGKSRDKVVKILVSVTPDEILEKLKKEAST